MKLSQLWAVVILIMFSLVAFSASALAAEVPEISGEAFVLMDAASGNILAESNSTQKWYPASTTKIMTLVLALEGLADGSLSLEDTVVTSFYAASMGGSQVYLYDGETRSLHEMLIAVAVGSGNDASVAVAEHIAGSNEAFVEMMNQKAKELGMKNTNFTNCHGLHDPNHYTTAADMAKLGLYAITVPKMLDYTSIYEYDFRPDPKPLKLWSTNRLLKWYDGVDGLKTGTTSEAKRNLVCTAERDSLRLITVVMGVGEANGHFTQTMKLLNYGFNEYSFKSFYKANEMICSVPVNKGETDEVEAIAEKQVGVTIKKNNKAEITTTLNFNTPLNAPITKGDILGMVQVKEGEKVLAEVDLLANADVAKISLIGQWREILVATMSAV
jgi:D-alanyl-D-alanine carboxypeptidase (penicillin-binding protein 5/6)